jgi:acyl dehydratase
MYFAEFQVGQIFTSPGRTITERDIVNFAGLSGDFNLIHTDAEYCKTTQLKQRMAHGLLSLAIASGLAIRTGILEGTLLAFRKIVEWKFVEPVFIADTLHVDMEINQTKAFPHLGGGVVTITLRVINQNDLMVMKGVWTILVMSEP